MNPFNNFALLPLGRHVSSPQAVKENPAFHFRLLTAEFS